MMKLKQLSAFCRRMGTGLKAGVDVLRLLDNETRTGDARHQLIMEEVKDKVQSGYSLAKAFIENKSYFPPLLIQLTHASELGGQLDRMFLYMADYYEQLKHTRSQFLGRLTWPLIQLFMAIGIIGLVILLQGLLSSNSSELSYDASGIGLSGVGGFVVYISVVGLVFGSIALLGFGIWKNWFGSHRILVPLIQRIPALGTAFVTLGLSRLSMTLSMLLNAGVDARRSIKQAFLSTGNYYFIGGMERAVAKVESGGSFGDAFDASQVLPIDFVDAVRVSELSGTETESLEHLAVQYQEQAKSALATIAVIASTVIWIGIILFMAFMIIRMAMQYINLLNSFLP